MMEIYKVCHNIDGSWETQEVMGYVRANNAQEAKKQLSIKLYGTEDTSMATTGYFSAHPIPERYYKEQYEKARNELSKFDRNLL